MVTNKSSISKVTILHGLYHRNGDLGSFYYYYEGSIFSFCTNRIFSPYIDVNNVVRIQRQDDPRTIPNKWADFSSGTIKK